MRKLTHARTLNKFDNLGGISADRLPNGACIFNIVIEITEVLNLNEIKLEQ